MGKWLRAVALALVTTFIALPGYAQNLQKVRTFTQTNYPGFIQYVTRELGLFTKYGLDPDMRFFPSGAPIVQAAAAKEWDVAFICAPPAVIGASSLGLNTKGMPYEESPTHLLIGRPDYVAKVRANHDAMKGAKIFVTTLSTGHYMTEGCLRKFGLKSSDVNIIPSEQTATLSAFSAGQGDLAQVWPPFTFALEERGNQVLCDGKQAGISIPSVWVTTKDFAASKPDLLVKWLKANGEAVDWIRKDKARTTDMYRKFMQLVGQTYNDKTLSEVVDVVMTAETLPDQLKALSASGGEKPYLIRSYEGIAQFFIRNGRLQQVPDFAPLVNASFLAQAVK
jgi:NitT/TauT family transport system substrate-binding protein